jgi:hypothetical protein
MIGTAYGQTMNYGSDLFNTNTNMQASIYNSFQNNQASLQGARLQAGASAAAGQSGMIGSIAGGAGAAIGGAAIAAVCWIARAAFGLETDRWQKFRRAMLRHASDRTIRLYCQHGQSIAATLTTPLRRLAARLTLRSLEFAWK